jgi:mono/diheme cytochrome c family protein
MLLALPAAGRAQEAPRQAPPEIKRVPIVHTATMSGKDLYISYCAACHGKTGKGDGPAAPALKAQPTDLTAVARNNSGKYASARMESVIRGQANIPSHGSREMPTWGSLFSSLSPGQEGATTVRVNNLVKYIETMQTK